MSDGRDKVFEGFRSDGIDIEIIKRTPLSDSVKAHYCSKLEEHKDWVDRSERWKEHSTQRYGCRD